MAQAARSAPAAANPTARPQLPWAAPLPPDEPPCYARPRARAPRTARARAPSPGWRAGVLPGWPAAPSGKYPIRRFASNGAADTSNPHASMLPPVGARNPEISRMVVVLPAPLGPRKP